MEPNAIALALVDLLILLVPLSFVCFILYKLLSPLREKIAEKYGLSWIKSCIVFNFSISFIVILLFYLYFFFLGAALAQPQDPELETTFIENILLIVYDSVRIIVASIIIALFLLFFEFVASMGIDLQEKKKYAPIFKQFLGVAVACAVFLLLMLFVFDWVPLGLFIYVMYGSIQPIPLLIC